MTDPLISKVLSATAQSELLATLARAQEDGVPSLALGGRELRLLFPEEIEQLESQGNIAEDWSRIQVTDDFHCRRIWHSSFQGSVVLGRFARQVLLASGVELPAGIFGSTLGNCVIGDDVLIRDVKLLANYIVAEGAVLFDCGSITCQPGTAFGNGLAIPLGIESGGWEVPMFAEIDVDTAAAIVKSRSRPELIRDYVQVVSSYAGRAVSRRGIIATGALVRDTPKIYNTFLGPYAKVDSATLVAESTVLSNHEEPARIQSGACVTHSLLQWGSRADTLAIVDHSVLTEHSSVERHGKVTNSIVGPNTAVAAGEVIASLLGPFVGFHHQALLIAAVWPEGKGNVSYGANVGSNHTSKAPDQEFWPGEGAFLGLGVNIKYPTDLSRAPYTMIACGVTTLPQKITFPFSLVNTPSSRCPGIPPAYNEIFPAWALTDNLYALKRNEGKFRVRNQARRMKFTFDVFRPDTAELMRDACRRLQKIPQFKAVYTDRDIPGLGKNFMFEASRQSAIEGYQFFIEYYALLGLLDRVRKFQRATNDNERTNGAAHDSKRMGIDDLLSHPSNDPAWEHQRQILTEDLELADVIDGLLDLPDMLEKIAREVERSKAKDDSRGPAVIDDYAATHKPAAKDPFVKQTWEETRRLQAEVKQFIDELSQPAKPKKTRGRAHELHAAAPQ
jgi:hypothetical protein